MLKPPAPTRKLSVCLLANHPLVLAEFERLVSHMPLRIHPKKMEPLAPDATVPRAGVYVIDFDGNFVTTEAIVAKIVTSYPGARLLLVGREFGDDIAFPLLRLGVKGLLQHSQLEDQLERALQAIATGGYWVPRALLSRFVDSVLRKAQHGANITSRAGLSRREKEVMKGLLENLSNKEIANKLNIAERTVKFHVSNLLQKFNVRRRADLIVLAYQESSTAVSSFSLAVPDENTRIQ
jgi:DNA-binding NarL/FixJ family response regulator